MLAHHLARSGSRSDPRRTLDACRRAADRAAAIGAWRVALTHGLVAIEAAEACDLAPKELAELSFKVGKAAALGRDRDLAVRYLAVASDLAESCDALATWGAAAIHLARESVEDREMYASAPLALARVERFLAAAGDAEPALRARAHALEAEIYSDRDLASAQEHAEIAERIAAELDDDDVRARVLFARGVRHTIAVEFDAARECFDNVRSAGAQLDDPNPRNWAGARLGVLAYTTGNLNDAELLLANAYADAHEADNGADCSFIAAASASVSAVRGHFARCEEDGERSRRAYSRAPYWFTPGILFPTLVSAAATRGDVAAAYALLAEWEGVQERVTRRYRPLVDAMVGEIGAARAALEANPFRLMTGARADLTASGPLAAQILLGALVGEPSLVEAPLDALTSFYERGMRFTVGWPTLVPRVIALAYDTLGAETEARMWFERAVNDARARGADAELGTTAREYGRFLRARGDANADDLFAVARHTANDLMSPTTSGAVTRAVLVTDLVASTALNNRLGDREYVALLREHDVVIRRQLARYDGVEFKHTGDGIAAWFFSTDGALRCACAVREEFAQGAHESQSLLQVKIALSVGEPIVVQGDLIGLSVTKAFRALEGAHAGEIPRRARLSSAAKASRTRSNRADRESSKGSLRRSISSRCPCRR